MQENFSTLNYVTISARIAAPLPCSYSITRYRVNQQQSKLIADVTNLTSVALTLAASFQPTDQLTRSAEPSITCKQPRV